MLQVTNIDKSYGKQLLFAGVSFTVNSRERVGLVGRLQGFFPGRDVRVQPFVEPGVVQEQGGPDVLDPAPVGRDRAVIGNRGVELRAVHGHQIDHPAAKAEADDADLA